mgnify:CR=1 FL=1
MLFVGWWAVTRSFAGSVLTNDLWLVLIPVIVIDANQITTDKTLADELRAAGTPSVFVRYGDSFPQALPAGREFVDLVAVIETDKAYAPTLVLYCLTSTIASVVDKKLVLEHVEAVTPSEENKFDNDFGYAWLPARLGADRVLDGDVVEVDRQPQPRQRTAGERRLDHHAGRPRLGGFLIEIAVAARRALRLVQRARGGRRIVFSSVGSNASARPSAPTPVNITRRAAATATNEDHSHQTPKAASPQNSVVRVHSPVRR